ncbi:MAG: FHA domain-containing protein [Hydrogenophaga sp.]|jgi:pSer/pThr/pTyr-binding forkhead associated (FHA) protein|uniref:FHA domain-containing protein n=1 Tax=Hydrogenophaga sp. TaxID=1904254 RepID=UPI0027274CC2|nr:FHA domain-containing protein [Hydrogenophaga sp.]MDO9483867.1 FHA domain-containing protein [Hydrogenophaga sp.]MDO9569355.1 FHA domain-containing protein [Hydrogenophaga sp.]MDP1894259.1 FHA domain-containing protein [Hydrogenophaga sp.]MDP3344382.1 FHA domain-containing protein [Hydrogenophaga sp.]MDP3375855.1 FHA domain-containing protein [Hydrogenophaga sp.]
MPKMFISIDGVVIKEVQLTKDRSTLGRRPYNDIVIDNLAVSGEHAVLQMTGSKVFLEDLNSTNGTYVNGKAVKKQLLQSGDTIEIGKYQIKFVNDGALEKPEKTMGSSAKAAADAPLTPAGAQAAVKVMSGPSVGRQVPLLKVVTTIGKPGVAVAAITRRSTGYVVALVEGAIKPTLNGNPIGTEAVNLSHGDLIELAGTQMQFVLQ